jgi:O-antigen/teichoic acid export membrane protein
MPELVRRRLLLGFGANAFGSLVTTAIQLITVPVLIHWWGTRMYGEWLVLIALPAFLAMSDWGFENVAGTEMGLAIARNDRVRALEVFQTLWVFVTLASGLIIVLVAAASGSLPIATWLVPGGLQTGMVTMITLVLVAHVAVMLHGGLIRAGFRSTGAYALGVIHQNLARVTDTVALVVIAIGGGGPLQAAVAMLASRVAMTAVAYWQMRSRNPWLHPGVERASVGTLRQLGPSIIAMMAFPLGFALNLQGMVTVIGLILGPVAVVTFSTLRTLSRLVFQAGGIISNATWPEFSFAFGEGDIVLARALHRRACQAVGWLTVSLALVTAINGAWIFKLWTRGAVPFSVTMMYVLLFVAVIDALWTASSIVSLGAGRYKGVSVTYLISTVLTLVVTVVALPSMGLSAAPIALLVGTLIMLPYVVRRSLTLTGDHLSTFLRWMLRPPAPRSLVFRQTAESRKVFQA